MQRIIKMSCGQEDLVLDLSTILYVKYNNIESKMYLYFVDGALVDIVDATSKQFLDLFTKLKNFAQHTRSVEYITEDLEPELV